MLIIIISKLADSSSVKYSRDWVEKRTRVWITKVQLKGGWSTWTKRRLRSIDRPVSWRGCSLRFYRSRVHIIAPHVPRGQKHNEDRDRGWTREKERDDLQQTTLRRRHGKSIYCRPSPSRYNHPTQCNDLQTGKILYCEISANRRSSVAVPGYDSSDHARARVQSAPIEGSHGS